MIATELSVGATGTNFRVDTDFDGPNVYFWFKTVCFAKHEFDKPALGINSHLHKLALK